MKVRLLSYNIRYGGAGRVGALAGVIGACAPDLVVLQEATRPDVVAALAEATGMAEWGARPAHSVAFLSRTKVTRHAWYRPPGSRRAFLEIVPAGDDLRIYGVHLSAVHSNWTERRRVRELRALLAAIASRPRDIHILAGDFNTVAPGATLDLRRLPPRLRAFAWLTGRKIRWETVQIMLDADYVDAYRRVHVEDHGWTFPAWAPHVRLDYVFVPSGWAPRIRACDVVTTAPGVTAASDHLPVLADLALDGA